MTRETKLGLMVASTFVVLLAIVIVYKMQEPGDATPVSPGQSPKVLAKADQKPSTGWWGIVPAVHTEPNRGQPGELPNKLPSSPLPGAPVNGAQGQLAFDPQKGVGIQMPPAPPGSPETLIPGLPGLPPPGQSPLPPPFAQQPPPPSIPGQGGFGPQNIGQQNKFDERLLAEKVAEANLPKQPGAPVIPPGMQAQLPPGLPGPGMQGTLQPPTAPKPESPTQPFGQIPTGPPPIPPATAGFGTQIPPPLAPPPQAPASPGPTPIPGFGEIARANPQDDKRPNFDKPPQSPVRDPQAPLLGATPTGIAPAIPAFVGPSEPPRGVGQVPGQPVSLQPQVKTFETKAYRCQDDDRDFQAISNKFYQSPKYADALLEYNRRHPQVQRDPYLNQAVQARQPQLRRDMVVYVPQKENLEDHFSEFIGKATVSPAPISPGVVGQVPPPPAFTQQPPVAPTQPPPVSQPPRLVQPTQPIQPESPALVSASGARTITLQAEMMYYQIAVRELGNGDRWNEIFNLNPQVDPRYPVPAGTVLRLPAVARN